MTTEANRLQRLGVQMAGNYPGSVTTKDVSVEMLTYPDGNAVFLPYIARYLLSLPQHTLSLCDLGCGKGQHLRYFAEQLPGKLVDAFGFDLQDDNIRAEGGAHDTLAKLSNVTAHLAVADIRSLELQPESYNLISAEDVFHFMDPHDLPALMARIARAMKPDGMFLFSAITPFNNAILNDGNGIIDLRRAPATHDNTIPFVYSPVCHTNMSCYSKQTVSALLSQHGLCIQMGGYYRNPVFSNGLHTKNPDGTDKYPENYWAIAKKA